MSSRPPGFASPAKGSRWLAQLRQVRSEAQLLKVCRGYLGSIRRAEIAALPLACRPIPLEDASDLSAYALQLVRYRCDVDEATELVLRMAAFFAHANMRMAQILRQMNESAEADRILARIGRPGRDDSAPESPPSAGGATPGMGADSE
jgi:hypothetical protein